MKPYLLLITLLLASCQTAQKSLDECVKISMEMYEVIVMQETELAELSEGKCRASFRQ